MVKTPEQFRKEFRLRVNALLNEYIAEAEHQDGEGYWSEYFNSVDEAVADFLRYSKFVVDPEGDE